MVPFFSNFSTAVSCMHCVKWTDRHGRGKQAIKRTASIYLIFKMNGGWYKRAHEGELREHVEKEAGSEKAWE